MNQFTCCCVGFMCTQFFLKRVNFCAKILPVRWIWKSDLPDNEQDGVQGHIINAKSAPLPKTGYENV